MEPTTSTFKILKSSWGIWIQVTGDSEMLDIEDKKVELEVDEKKIRRSGSVRELEYIRGGIKWVTPLILESVKSGIKINIFDFKIILTEYQVEGLFYASAFWAAEHFNFELPKYSVEFNESKNKYIFSDLDID